MINLAAKAAHSGPRLVWPTQSTSTAGRQWLPSARENALVAIRCFATRPLLLLTPPSSHTLLRPQLPFLHAPASSAILLRQPLRTHLQRPISTNQRSYYQKIYEGLKLALSCYILILLYHIIKTGLHQERIERIYPTPRSWSLWSRWRLRTARSLQDPGRFGKLAVDWAKVAVLYSELLERLEDETIDGTGLVALEHGKENEIIYDATGMSAEWREGYFQALMGAGSSAEKMDGWVRDTESGNMGPGEYIVGPSNPNPRISPPRNLPDAKAPVLHEEHCIAAYKTPETYYRKILSTAGFRDNQRLDAALAYADWLDYKGWKEEATKMYSTAMDIAASALGSQRRLVVDETTGILKAGANAFVTENLLRASTAIAVHHVRSRDLPIALSAFLSVLRARQALPKSSSWWPSQETPCDEDASSEPSILQTALSWFKESRYMIPTLTGNEPASRSQLTACEEAGLMVYIGEVLFASSSQQEGLAWTRDAVDLAESTLLALSDDADSPADQSVLLPATPSLNHAPAPDRCRDCLKAGLDNWSHMVRRLVRDAEQKEYESIQRVREPSWVDRWLRPLVGSSLEKTMRQEMIERRRWEAEQAILTDRVSRAKCMLGDQGFEAMGVGQLML